MSDEKFLHTPGLKSTLRELDALLSRSPEFPPKYPILILGPSGTGKTLMYKRIIEYAKKATNNPQLNYRIINCASISRSLVESELFGYKKGAFTGATKDKIGLLGAAKDGIAVLDEIGELPRYIQAKLLTFLDTKKIIRVGATDEETVDTFIIGTSNVSKKRFREDFWERFDKIQIPPLHKRRKDILYLMRHFCGEHEVLGWQLLECLCQPWQGNIRELNRKWHQYIQENQPALTMNDFIEDSPYVNYIPFDVDHFREKLRNPIFFIKNSPFYNNGIEKKFPVLLSDDTIKLKDCHDELLEDLYKEFWRFCEHFHQDPCLSGNILSHIAKNELTLDGCLLDVHGKVAYIEEIASLDIPHEDLVQPDQEAAEPSEPSSLPTHPPNLCNMDEISPKKYFKEWLTYHIVKQHKSQKVVAKMFGISPQTISRWCKKYDIKPLDAYDEEPDAN